MIICYLCKWKLELERFCSNTPAVSCWNILHFAHKVCRATGLHSNPFNGMLHSNISHDLVHNCSLAMKCQAISKIFEDLRAMILSRWEVYFELDIQRLNRHGSEISASFQYRDKRFGMFCLTIKLSLQSLSKVKELTQWQHTNFTNGPYKVNCLSSHCCIAFWSFFNQIFQDR